MIRTLFVISEKPQEVASAVITQLQRGVTYVPARGMYTGIDKGMLYITVSRSQVNDAKQIITDVDEAAFVVIAQGHTAYGAGFKPIGKRRRLQEVKPLPSLTDLETQAIYEPKATGD